MQGRNDKERVTITKKHRSCVPTAMVSDVAPRSSFDARKLDNDLRTSPPPFLLTGGLTLMNQFWEIFRWPAVGRTLVQLSSVRNMLPLNDGSPTDVTPNRYIRSLDLAIASSECFSKCSWITDVETHGSDHMPTYTYFTMFYKFLEKVCSNMQELN